MGTRGTTSRRLTTRTTERFGSASTWRLKRASPTRGLPKLITRTGTHWPSATASRAPHSVASAPPSEWPVTYLSRAREILGNVLEEREFRRARRAQLVCRVLVHELRDPREEPELEVVAEVRAVEAAVHARALSEEERRPLRERLERRLRDVRVREEVVELARAAEGDDDALERGGAEDRDLGAAAGLDEELDAQPRHDVEELRDDAPAVRVVGEEREHLCLVGALERAEVEARRLLVLVDERGEVREQLRRRDVGQRALHRGARLVRREAPLPRALLEPGGARDDDDGDDEGAVGHVEVVEVKDPRKS